MSKILLFILLIVFPGVYTHSEINPADIVIKPHNPVVYFTPGEGVLLDVMVLNKGGETLTIKEVKGSCYCASVIVNNKDLRPMGKGKLTLQVSTERMGEDSLTRVDYTVYSNAKDSIYSFPLLLLNRLFVKDSVKNN